MSTPSAVFGRRLREERERARLTQAELGQRMAEIMTVKVDPSAVSRIEGASAGRVLKFDEAVAAAQALDVPLASLVSDEPPETARLRELREALQRERNRADAAEAEFQQAQLAVAHIEQEIQQLEAAGRD